ncbi:MAG: AI-2E family transporter [Proteobacteria bacterium]|nr:MAG: AI-2E family transporter [Pseudomonadota bacterium]
MAANTKWFWLAMFGVTGIMLYLLAPILLPFVTGALLAYLGDPLVDRLETYKISRTASVLIVFTVLFCILLPFLVVLVTLLENQVSDFDKNFHIYIEWFSGTVEPLLTKLGISVPSLNIERLGQTLTEEWSTAGGFLKGLISTVSRSGLAVMGWLANIVLIPVITFYLLRDWDRLVAYIRELLPRNVEPKLVMLAEESDEVLGAFLRGQMLVMLALSFMYSVGLAIVGVNFALLIGIISGIISFVPYMGLIVGMALAGISAFVETQSFMMVFWVFVVFGIAQMVEGMLLTPLLVGDRIGLHPVAVIFAVLAGGQLFGFFGILLALPAFAVLAVLLRHAHDSYIESQIYRF